MPHLSKRERFEADVAAWLSRHRAKFPNGFSADAITKQVDWERARYLGMLKLKSPEERMVVQLPEEHRKQLRSFGAHDFDKVTVYQKRVGPRRYCIEATDLALHLLGGRSPSGIGRLLAELARSGTLEPIPGSRPKAYRFPTKRLVFGVDRERPAAIREA